MMNYKQFVTIIILAGDFNARVGAQLIGKCIGSEGEQTVNNNGRDLTDFCLFNKFKITDTFFRCKNILTFMWEARGSNYINDYIVINEKLKTAIRDKSI
jgi:hypothetical protein